MEITKTLYIASRKDWRAWLKKHYQTEKEIWLVYPKKATSKPRIEYNDASLGKQPVLHVQKFCVAL